MGRIAELEQLIVHHKILYYRGAPEISDSEFDALEEELQKISPNSSVLRMVGSGVKSEGKVSHRKKMLSLMKTYKVEELLKWVGNEEVVSTYKLDGVSCSLMYEKGTFVLAKTRGDGEFGEDVSAHIMWMEHIPKNLIEDNSIDVEIRGELYCDEEHFIKLSNEMERKKLERPSSQRNIVAGLMGRKDNIDLCSFLQFRAFEYLSDHDQSQFEMEHFSKLKKLQFLIPEYELHRDHESIVRLLKEIPSFMSDGEYQIDGVVFSYNRLSLHEELGATAHHPRCKMAFKFQGETRDTIILNIEWSVSRNGILTPVALVETVELSGAEISRVTLHNYGMVKEFKLKKGDLIQIIRSGEVIPKFLSVVTSSDEPFSIPVECPSCGTTLLEKEIRLICPNEECGERRSDTILNFVQKIGIEDLSFKRLEEMMRKGLVSDIPSLYDLTVEKLMTLDKVKEKLAQKLFENIQKSKNVSLKVFLSALGISGGAYNKCEKVVNGGIDSLEKLKQMKLEDLLQIDSFAEKSATDFLDSFTSKLPMVEKLVQRGFVFLTEEKQLKTHVQGKKFCITGALSEKRSVVEKNISDAGGVVVGSVSKNCDYLITNEVDSSSSKFVKAKELSITIMNESDLKKFLK